MHRPRVHAARSPTCCNLSRAMLAPQRGTQVVLAGFAFIKHAWPVSRTPVRSAGSECWMEAATRILGGWCGAIRKRPHLEDEGELEAVPRHPECGKAGRCACPDAGDKFPHQPLHVFLLCLSGGAALCSALPAVPHSGIMLRSPQWKLTACAVANIKAGPCSCRSSKEQVAALHMGGGITHGGRAAGNSFRRRLMLQTWTTHTSITAVQELFPELVS
jgi:hypothetical protein